MKKMFFAFVMACFLSIGMSYATGTPEKVADLNANEVLAYFESELSDALEISHLQSAEDLKLVKERFNLDKELAYVRVYRQDNTLSAIAVAKDNSAVVFTEVVESMTDCACHLRRNYHIPGDPFWCARACEGPGGPGPRAVPSK